MGKIDRKRTRCCGKYECICGKKATFAQKYPWKDSSAAAADQLHKLKEGGVADSTDRKLWVDGNNKKKGIRVNKVKWK